MNRGLCSETTFTGAPCLEIKDSKKAVRGPKPYVGEQIRPICQSNQLLQEQIDVYLDLKGGRDLLNRHLQFPNYS